MVARSASGSGSSVEVDRLCYQYLQLEPALDYPKSSLLQKAEIQEEIYERLFAEDALPFPPPLRYQARVLKQLLGKIEDSIDDWEEYGVSDKLSSRLADFIARPLPSEMAGAQQKNYVTYHLSLLGPPLSNEEGSPPDTVTLLESRSLVSASGTTGLRTWEAALHLGQYLCTSPSLVTGKRILELGAGTGYLSIICARQLGAAHVLASDGSEEVVAALPDNFLLNGLETSEERASAIELRWGHARLGADEAGWNGGRDIDVVLGADITYDKSIVGALAGTIAELLEKFPGADVIIAATQRNERTFEGFLDVCKQYGFVVTDVAFKMPRRAEQKGPFYDDRVRIRICRISDQKDSIRAFKPLEHPTA